MTPIGRNIPRCSRVLPAWLVTVPTVQLSKGIFFPPPSLTIGLLLFSAYVLKLLTSVNESAGVHVPAAKPPVTLAPSFYLSLSFFACFRSIAPKWALSVYKCVCVCVGAASHTFLQTACFEPAGWSWNGSRTSRAANASVPSGSV